MVLIGNRVPKQPGIAAQPYDLADLLDLVRVAGRVAGTQLTVRQAERPWTHPGRTAEVLLDGEPIGYAAELAPALAKEAALPRVLVAEIDLGRVIEARRTLLEPRLIAPVPAATQDLSLTVAADIPASDVLASVREGAGALLEHIGLVDDYRGEGIPEGQKSLTFALRFRAADRTLTAEEASEAKLAGVARAEAAHGAVLRAE